MKVGFLKTNPPDPKLEAGVGTYLSELIPALQDLGVKASTFWIQGPGSGAPGHPYRLARSTWTRYRHVHWRDSGLVAALSEWVGAERPDVLHCHWSPPRMLSLLRDLPADFPPLIMNFHTYAPVCPLNTHVTKSGALCREVSGGVCLREGCRSLRKWLMHDVNLRRLRRKYSSRAALYISHNRDALRYVERAGFRPARYVPMGLARQPVSEPGPREPILLYAGRLRPEKGVHTIMRALNSIFEAVPRAEMRFAGSGSEFEALREAAAPFGPRVKLLGHLAPEALDREYAQAGALLMPSEWKEHFGLVGLEAMAHGTPVISSLVGGIQDWLRPGVNGLAFELGNPASLAAQAIAILKDPDLGNTLSLGALQTAREFNIQDHARVVREIYSEVLTHAS